MSRGGTCALCVLILGVTNGVLSPQLFHLPLVPSQRGLVRHEGQLLRCFQAKAVGERDIVEESRSPLVPTVVWQKDMNVMEVL